MALAIHLESLLQSGAITNRAALARLGGVSRARVTQILNLNYLAPSIQEELLFLTHDRCRAPVLLADLQPITRELSWARQRERWRLEYRMDDKQNS